MDAFDLFGGFFSGPTKEDSKEAKWYRTLESAMRNILKLQQLQPNDREDVRKVCNWLSTFDTPQNQLQLYELYKPHASQIKGLVDARNLNALQDYVKLLDHNQGRALDKIAAALNGDLSQQQRNDVWLMLEGLNNCAL